MTVTSAPGAAVEKRGRPGHPDHRRLRDQRAQGHPGDPGRRADRHPGPAVLRPPAARPGGRLPPVPGRGRGPAQAARVLHHHRHRRHGRQDPAHLAGRRQGAARRDGAAAHQPPAGLPGLRQGRRVPAAEPGDEQRPRRDPVHRRQAHLPQADQHLLPGAARPRALRAVRPLHPVLQQVAGDPFIEMLERGALQQVGIYEAEPFQSYFSGNTVQICPVGALTGAAYRFRSRPFDLVSSPGVCEHCASGCAIRTDHRRGKVLRRLAGDDPEVNEEWNCDKGRWAFQYATAQDRLTTPAGPGRRRRARADVLGRGARHRGPRAWPRPAAPPASWSAAGATVEDAYGYAKLARMVLGTNDIDFRARPHSAEEASFLAAHVAGTRSGVTYDDLEQASSVLLLGLEPEDESPILFLRLRKARPQGPRRARRRPVREPRPGEALRDPAPRRRRAPRHRSLDRLRTQQDLLGAGSVVLVGERLAAVPGALSAAVRLVEATGARLAWVPRRAGERGALGAGALPTLLPGGRPLADAAARVDVATAWGVDHLSGSRGPRHRRDPGRGAHRRDPARCWSAASTRGDLPDPAAALAALDAAPFVVSLELRASEVTERADVVLPVAAAVGEGRHVRRLGGPQPAVRRGAARHQRDARRAGAARAGRRRWAPTSGCPTSPPHAPRSPSSGSGTATGAAFAPVVGAAHRGSRPPARPCWPPGRSCSTPAGCRTASRSSPAPPATAVARLSAATAEALGVADGGCRDRVHRPRRRHGCRCVVTEMPDGVVWLPTNAAGLPVRRELAAAPGSVVRIAVAPARSSGRRRHDPRVSGARVPRRCRGSAPTRGGWCSARPSSSSCSSW